MSAIDGTPDTAPLVPSADRTPTSHLANINREISGKKGPPGPWPPVILWVLLATATGVLCRWYYRRQTAKALRALENRYAPIVELSNQLFYDYDVASGQITWAGAIASVTGYQPEEFRSVDIAKWADMIHPDDLDDALKLLDRAHLDVSNYRVEYRFRQKNSRYTHVEDEGRFFPGGDGRAVRMLGTMKDVSIRKEAERKLQEAHAALRQLNSELEQRVRQRTSELTTANQNLLKSEERFRTIFEYVSIGMCLTSIDARFLMVNRSLCAMLGYSEAELLSKSFADITDPHDVHISSQRMARLLSGEMSQEIYEKRYRHKNGQVVWVLIGIYLLHDGQAQPSHFICHIQDVTRRKQDQAQLQRLHAAIEQAGEGIIITSPQGIIEYVNPAFGRITGYALSETIGQDPRFFDRGQHHADFYQEIRDALAAGKMWSGQATHRKKSGLPMIAEASISPIHRGSGQNFGYVAVIRDITEKQILENRLKQAQKMEAIGTLAGGIAHDFNNILGGMIGCSEMALLEVGPQSIAHCDLEKILEAGLRAKSLIKQILTFSREGECEMAPMDLSPLVKETIKLLRVSCPACIEVRLNAPQGLRAVMADPIQMQQVLMNLCTNALHAMQADGGILEVNLAETTIAASESDIQTGVHPGDYLKLTVRDTGCGIPAELVERIFDPFFTTKKVGEGTGLGLSMVHGIIKKHGGAITVRSQLDGGTVFKVLIPLLEHAVACAQTSPVIPLPRGNERILLVDDEKLLCDVLLRMLEDLGYQMQAESNGEQAYRAFQSRPQAFDLLLTDQTMSDMTGLELARRITRIRPDLPVILCTGFSQALPPAEARSAGIQAILHKPLVRTHVATTLRRVLDDPKNAPAACQAKGFRHG